MTNCKMKHRNLLYLLSLLIPFISLNAKEIKVKNNKDNVKKQEQINQDSYIENNNFGYNDELKSEKTYEYDIENSNTKNASFDEKMTFEEILRYTFDNNDTLNAERAKTKAVKTLKFKTIGENALPDIGIDLTYGYTDFKQKFDTLGFKDNGTLTNNRIYLEQPIFKSGRTVTKVKSVNSQINMQMNKLYQTEQEVLFDTIQSTINLLQAKEILDITIKNEESLKNSYEYIAAKKRVGRVTSSDLSLAEARYSSAKSDTIVASTQYLNTKATFLKITKIDPSIIEVNYENIFKSTFDYSIGFDQILEMALSKNPQYQMAKNNYEMNRNNLNYTKTDFFPEVYLNAEVGRQETTDIITQRNASVSLNLKVPLFQSGTEYASHREAGHLLNEAKFTLNDVKDDLMKQSMMTYDEFLSSKSLIVSSKAYRNAAKLTLDSTVAEEKVGKSTLVDVLDRRKEYFDTEINFLKNKTNVIKYYYMLKLLMGELNLTDLFIK